MDSPSPTREQKARQAVAEAAASVSASGGKWKMQIGNANAGSGSSRFKKKPDREEWPDEQDKRQQNNDAEPEDPKKALPPPVAPAEKNMSVRKAMAMKEPQPPPKKEAEPMKKLPKVLPPAPTTKPMITPGQVVLDKFGNFRLVTPPESKKSGDGPPLPPGAPPKDYG